MKKNKAQKFRRLEHISADNIAFLADQAQCDKDYVRKILSGRRAITSAKAIAIYKVAKIINSANEKSKLRWRQTIKLFIGEND